MNVSMYVPVSPHSFPPTLHSKLAWSTLWNSPPAAIVARGTAAALRPFSVLMPVLLLSLSLLLPSPLPPSLPPLQTGVVYAVEFSHRSGRDLVNMAKKRTNVIPIIEDARHPQRYRMLVGMVDTIFADVAQPDQVIHDASAREIN